MSDSFRLHVGWGMSITAAIVCLIVAWSWRGKTRDECAMDTNRRVLVFVCFLCIVSGCLIINSVG